MKLSSLCVYCGSSSGSDPVYLRAADDFGRRLAGEGITVVYGGGNVGLMGAVADGALRAGGEVIGVIPEQLVEKELAHLGLTELHRVSSMHERKLKMADLSDAFVALPGGVGTMEEIFEVFTWTQLGLHGKPCAFLDVKGYYARLFEFLDHMVGEEFIKEEHFHSFIRSEDPEDLLRRLRDYRPVVFDKWIDRIPGRQVRP